MESYRRIRKKSDAMENCGAALPIQIWPNRPTPGSIRQPLGSKQTSAARIHYSDRRGYAVVFLQTTVHHKDTYAAERYAQNLALGLILFSGHLQ